MLTSWVDLAKRAVLALERIADALEAHALAGEPAKDDLEVIASGR